MKNWFKSINSHAVGIGGGGVFAAGLTALLTQLSSADFLLAMLSPNRGHVLATTLAISVVPMIVGTIAAYFGRPLTIPQANPASSIMATDIPKPSPPSAAKK